MRIWNVLAVIMLASGLLVNFGFAWSFFDLNAHTQWERHMTGTLYILASLVCMAADDALQAIRANRRTQDD